MSQAEHAVEAAGLRAEGLESRLRGSHASVARADADVAEARVRAGYARIVAPGRGVVVDKRVEVGELASPGRVLMTLDDPSSYRLDVELAAADAARVQRGQAVTVWVDVAAGRELAGRVQEVVPAADPASRTVTVKVELGRGAGLRSGLYGRARFTLGTAERLLIPADAVRERGQLSGVYVVDREGVARLRLVTLGQRHDARVEVLSGLEPGERLVVDGLEGLRDGSRVAEGR